MKQVTFFMFFLVITSCAYRHGNYSQRQNHQCIPPTYQNAVQRVGVARGLIGVIDAGMHGHLYQNNTSLSDQMTQQALHDLRVEYRLCLQNKMYRQQKAIMAQRARAQRARAQRARAQRAQTYNRDYDLINETYKEMEQSQKQDLKSWAEREMAQSEDGL